MLAPRLGLLLEPRAVGARSGGRLLMARDSVRRSLAGRAVHQAIPVKIDQALLELRLHCLQADSLALKLLSFRLKLPVLRLEPLAFF